MALCERVIGSGDDNELLLSDNDGPQARNVLIAQVEAEVGCASLDHLSYFFLTTDAGDEFDLAVPIGKIRQDRRKEVGQRALAGEDDAAIRFRFGAAQVARHIVGLDEHLARVSQENLPDFGETDTAATASLEQIAARFELERADVGADRGLGHAKPLSRRAEPAAFGNGDENLQSSYRNSRHLLPPTKSISLAD
jgi:hypothetical protein